MSAPRLLLTLVLAAVALVLQTAALTPLAWHGVVPDLVLLVVVATGLLSGSQNAMVLGFASGLLLDLAPPADHAAGRWALALLLAGWVAGRVRADAGAGASLPSLPSLRGGGFPGREHRGPSLPQVLVTVAGCSFLASSVYAVTGLLLGDSASGVGDLLTVVVAGVVLDVATALVLVPLAGLLLRRRARRRSDRRSGPRSGRRTPDRVPA